jgi:hypothetical protein
MYKSELENLREKLNSMLISEEYSYKEILKISQKLDVLIVRYIKENGIS